ncbi:hypothetical protein YC2023_005202 [Brassica napus]
MKKSTSVLASCPQSTKMVLLTGGSRKACSIITVPHHDCKSEWSSSSYFNATPLHKLQPFEFYIGDEVRHLRSAARCLTAIVLRVGYADISPTFSLIWVWSMLFTKTVSPLFSSTIINSQIIKSSERAYSP